jgi:hypothetical protein
MPIAVPCDGGETSGGLGATALKHAALELDTQLPQSQDESCAWFGAFCVAAVSDCSF